MNINFNCGSLDTVQHEKQPPFQSQFAVCDSTHYGINCTNECKCVANNTVDCNNTTGECSCKAGWTGTFCNDCALDGFQNINGFCKGMWLLSLQNM